MRKSLKWDIRHHCKVQTLNFITGRRTLISTISISQAMSYLGCCVSLVPHTQCPWTPISQLTSRNSPNHFLHEITSWTQRIPFSPSLNLRNSTEKFSSLCFHSAFQMMPQAPPFLSAAPVPDTVLSSQGRNGRCQAVHTHVHTLHWDSCHSLHCMDFMLSVHNHILLLNHPLKPVLH